MESCKPERAYRFMKISNETSILGTKKGSRNKVYFEYLQDNKIYDN